MIFIADCTGHGVPGAFLTLVVANALEQLSRAARDSGNQQRLRSPAEMLRALDKMVRWRLQQSGDADFDDGFEAGLCLWDPRSRKLDFAGAGIGLLQIGVDAAGATTSAYFKGSRKGLGASLQRNAETSVGSSRLDIVDQYIVVPENARHYLFTDGMTDHLGGLQRQLFGRKRLSTYLEKTHTLLLAKQLSTVKQELARYRGGEAIRDDITCIAFEL
jgi:serine phosphatase RsbU (regulator of sigma subunit)